MEVQIKEENIESFPVLQKTLKILLTPEEYEKLKTIFCKGKGWILDYPHTVTVHSMTLTGSYKWHPPTGAEFHIEIEKRLKGVNI